MRQLSLSVVTYGTADTLPTPILKKIYFGGPQVVMNTLREAPHEYGLGQTGSGGGKGMAALEGLVAALEVRYAVFMENVRIWESFGRAVRMH